MYSFHNLLNDAMLTGVALITWSQESQDDIGIRVKKCRKNVYIYLKLSMLNISQGDNLPISIQTDLQYMKQDS